MRARGEVLRVALEAEAAAEVELYPRKERKDLQYLGAEQCRIILGPAHITKSVESHLYGMHDCLRIAGCGRKEMLQTGQSELRPLRVLAFVRAVGIEQKCISCHKLPLFLVIGKRLLHAEGNVRRCA